jgi:DNA mismatch endonuclease, patch repair protein
MTRGKVPKSPRASSKAVSAAMRGNTSRHTRPELAARSLLFCLGYRYVLHSETLPGRPDIVFTRKRKVILVHGCFWHQHGSSRCTLRSFPRSNLAYWRPKLRRNSERDSQQLAALSALGWKVKVVWECEIGSRTALMASLRSFLGPPRS